MVMNRKWGGHTARGKAGNQTKAEGVAKAKKSTRGLGLPVILLIALRPVLPLTNTYTVYSQLKKPIQRGAL